MWDVTEFSMRNDELLSTFVTQLDNVPAYLDVAPKFLMMSSSSPALMSTPSSVEEEGGVAS